MIVCICVCAGPGHHELCGALPSWRAAVSAATSRLIYLHHQHCPQQEEHWLRGTPLTGPNPPSLSTPDVCSLYVYMYVRAEAAGSCVTTVRWSLRGRAGPSCTRAVWHTTMRVCQPPGGPATSWCPLWTPSQSLHACVYVRVSSSWCFFFMLFLIGCPMSPDPHLWSKILNTLWQ